MFLDKIHINWDVDFERKILDGYIKYDLIAARPDVQKIILDIRDLKIKAVKDSTGNALAFNIGESYMTMGKPLTINLPALAADE